MDYSYFYYNIAEYSKALKSTNSGHKIDIFCGLLDRIALAARDIQWVKEGKLKPGEEEEALEGVFKYLGPGVESIAKCLAYDKVMADLKRITKSLDVTNGVEEEEEGLF